MRDFLIKDNPNKRQNSSNTKARKTTKEQILFCH